MTKEDGHRTGRMPASQEWLDWVKSPPCPECGKIFSSPQRLALHRNDKHSVWTPGLGEEA
jgi:hypothetical protein